MSFTFSSVINTASHILNDVTHVTHSENELLQYANDALDVLLDIAPKYFYACGQITCVAGCMQRVNFENVHLLVSVNSISGSIVLPIDKISLDRFKPDWCTDDPGPAKNWARHLDSPTTFYVYPPSPIGQVLMVTYIQVPNEYTATQIIDLPATLVPVIVDYVVGMAMSKDDEHINAGRAQAFLNSFVAKAKGVQNGSSFMEK